MILCAENKKTLRSLLKEKRAAIPQERREEVIGQLSSSLLPVLKSFKTVLSFHSFADEIDTRQLNAYLTQEGKLLLPKINQNTLSIHWVNPPLNHLQPNSWGLIEPDPLLCPEIDLSQIECILVPALGFDSQKHRIGYGKGHYDRFLGKMKRDGFCPKLLGLGFKEQFVEEGLPYEDHDIPLDEIFLF